MSGKTFRMLSGAVLLTGLFAVQSARSSPAITTCPLVYASVQNQEPVALKAAKPKKPPATPPVGKVKPPAPIAGGTPPPPPKGGTPPPPPKDGTPPPPPKGGTPPPPRGGTPPPPPTDDTPTAS